MTDFTVKFLNLDGKELLEKKYKVKHFRQYNGSTLSPNGGHTCLFDLSTGHVLVSRCRSTEQYSRRKGVLTCIQKYLRGNNLEPIEGAGILKAESFTDGIKLTVHNSPEPHYWWLD